MGNSPKNPGIFNISQYAPPLQQYKLKHCGINYYIWQHHFQNLELIQFPINVYNQKYLNEQIQIFLFRHRHHLLVSNDYFRYNSQTGKASVFYQRVFTNLSRIKDLPFEDSLLLYFTAFKGFQVLYRRFGYFNVQEGMFHITKNKKIKVWCHKDIQKLRPKEQQNNQMKKETRSKGNEQTMVKKIISIIEQNLDPSLTNIPISSILYQSACNFSSAVHKLTEICTQNNIIIPERLSCIEIISKGKVGIILDQYGQLRQPDLVVPEPLQAKDIIKANLQRFQINPAVLENTPIAAFNQPQIGHKIVKIVAPLNSIQDKQTKKVKGLQISSNFQKPIYQFVDSEQIFYPKNDRLPPHSPIKQLQFNHITIKPPKLANIINYSNNTPTIRYERLSHNQSSKMRFFMQNPHTNTSNLAKTPSFYIMNPQQTFKTLHPPPNLIVNRPVIRRNSVDCFKNVSHKPVTQIYRPNTQYQVFVNYVSRPSSSLERPVSPVPENSTLVYKKPNALQINRNDSSDGSLSQLKHNQNIKHIENVYRRTEQNLIRANKESNINTNKQNINMFNKFGKSILKKTAIQNHIQPAMSNETFCKTVIDKSNKNDSNMRRTEQKQNEQIKYETSTTIFNRLKSLNSYQSNNSTNNNTNSFQNQSNNKKSTQNTHQIQFNPNLQNYQDFKNRFDSYKKNFNFVKRQTQFDPNYQKQYVTSNPGSLGLKSTEVQGSNMARTPTVAISSHQATYSFSNIKPLQKPPSPCNLTHNDTHLNKYNNSENPQAVPSAGTNQINNIVHIKDSGKSFPKPFFNGTLNEGADTVLSYPDSSTGKPSYIDNGVREDKNGGSNLCDNKGNNQFPSNTDISQYVSYIPNLSSKYNLQKNARSISEKNSASVEPGWKEQSMALNKNIGQSRAKVQEEKQYSHKIDDDIWADMQQAMARNKQVNLHC